MRNSNEQLKKEKISYVHGYIDCLINGFSQAFGINNLDEILAERLSPVLQAGRPRVQDRMSLLQLSSPGANQAERTTLETHGYAHSNKTSGKVKVKRKYRKNSYWSSMTKAERSAEVSRRQAKRWETIRKKQQKLQEQA